MIIWDNRINELNNNIDQRSKIINGEESRLKFLQEQEVINEKEIQKMDDTLNRRVKADDDIKKMADERFKIVFERINKITKDDVSTRIDGAKFNKVKAKIALLFHEFQDDHVELAELSHNCLIERISNAIKASYNDSTEILTKLWEKFENYPNIKTLERLLNQLKMNEDEDGYDVFTEGEYDEILRSLDQIVANYKDNSRKFKYVKNKNRW